MLGSGWSVFLCRGQGGSHSVPRPGAPDKVCGCELRWPAPALRLPAPRPRGCWVPPAPSPHGLGQHAPLRLPCCAIWVSCPRSRPPLPPVTGSCPPCPPLCSPGLCEPHGTWPGPLPCCSCPSTPSDLPLPDLCATACLKLSWDVMLVFEAASPNLGRLSAHPLPLASLYSGHHVGQGASQMPWTPVLAAPPLRLADGLQRSGWRPVPRSEGGAQAGSLHVRTAVAALGLQTSEWVLSRAEPGVPSPLRQCPDSCLLLGALPPLTSTLSSKSSLSGDRPLSPPLPTPSGGGGQRTASVGQTYTSARIRVFFSGNEPYLWPAAHRPWGEGPLGICRGAVCGPADRPHAVDLEAQVRCAGLLVGLRLCI